jgi:hypothetical protein
VEETGMKQEAGRAINLQKFWITWEKKGNARQGIISHWLSHTNK